MIKFGLNGTISIGGFEFTLNSSSSTRTTDDKNIIEGTTTTTVTNDSDNSDNAYDGEFIYSDEEINKVFEVTPINGFVSESNYNSIQYISDVVEYDIYGIQNFNDAKALADSVYSYN